MSRKKNYFDCFPNLNTDNDVNIAADKSTPPQSPYDIHWLIIRAHKDKIEINEAAREASRR